MLEDFNVDELKQMIEEQKERIDELIRLQAVQGLTLSKIEYITLNFSYRRKFLNKIQSLLGCNSSSMEKIGKEIPEQIELKWETYQKGRGYNILPLVKEDQLDDGYEFDMHTIKKSYLDGKVYEHDERYMAGSYLVDISLNQYLTKDEIRKISNSEEEFIHLSWAFLAGNFLS